MQCSPQLVAEIRDLAPRNFLPSLAHSFFVEGVSVNKVIVTDALAVFSACELQSSLDRMDVHLWNYRFPWEEEDDFTKEALGFVHVCIPKPDGAYYRINKLTFESDATGLAWCEKRRYLYVGLKTGLIKVFHFSDDFAEYTLGTVSLSSSLSSV